jgi:hypothetical protein
MNHIEIGPAPTCETCAQVGADDYAVRSRRECAVFARMLERVFPIPEGVQAKFKVKTFDHEFGVYREVVVEYDGPDGAEYAYEVERSTPERWDPVAQFELFWHEQRAVYDNAVREGRMTIDKVPACLKAAMPPVAPAASSFMDLVRAHGL